MLPLFKMAAATSVLHILAEISKFDYAQSLLGDEVPMRFTASFLVEIHMARFLSLCWSARQSKAIRLSF